MKTVYFLTAAEADYPSDGWWFALPGHSPSGPFRTRAEARAAAAKAKRRS